MQTMHPTLLIGPADWDAARTPLADYEARIAALFVATQAEGAIVFGNSLDHAALAYLTGFTPKLDEGMALIPRKGAPRLLVRGSVNMIAAAKPLTWVSELMPLGAPGKGVADWARTLPAGGRLLLIGGDAMPFALRQALDKALAGIAIEDATGHLQKQMLRKAPRELATLREACSGLSVAVRAWREAQKAGAGVTDAVLAAEHAASGWGAQDVRSLFSLDKGRTLQPFDVPVERAIEPLQAYFAVRHAGYWAEGFVRLSGADDPLQAQASDILRQMLAAAKHGATSRELARIAERGRGALQVHPLADPIFGNSIGLALQEPPLLRAASDVRLEAGAVYSLRAGVRDGEGGAVVSAMVHVTDGGSEILWQEGETA